MDFKHYDAQLGCRAYCLPHRSAELCRACQVERQQFVALIQDGVLERIDDEREHWRFGGAAIQRPRTALRLTRDLKLSQAAAVVLDLWDEIAALNAQRRRHCA